MSWLQPLQPLKKKNTQTTFRSISGPTLPSMHHNNSTHLFFLSVLCFKLPPLPCAVLPVKMVENSIYIYIKPTRIQLHQTIPCRENLRSFSLFEENMFTQSSTTDGNAYLISSPMFDHECPKVSECLSHNDGSKNKRQHQHAEKKVPISVRIENQNPSDTL